MYVFQEPVGSVAPRINLGDKLGFAVSEWNSSLALFCPAQSFPVPAFRYKWFCRRFRGYEEQGAHSQIQTKQRLKPKIGQLLILRTRWTCCPEIE